MMTVSTLVLLLVVQPKAPPKATSAPAPATSSAAALSPAFKLVVKGGLNGKVEIRAAQIETKAIIDRLKMDLKIPFVLSNIVAQHKVDLVLKEASVPQLLLSLAPVVLADIEVGPSPEDTVWKTIHLLGYNEREPPRALKQVGVLVGAGNTEDETVTPEDVQAEADKEAAKGLVGDATPAKPMLAVAVKDGRVSVRARQQNLAALLNEVAIRAGVPFDIRGALDPIPIDIEIKDMALKDLPLALGRASVRLVIRRNLGTGDEVVQGVLFGDPRPATAAK